MSNGNKAVEKRHIGVVLSMGVVLIACAVWVVFWSLVPMETPVAGSSVSIETDTTLRDILREARRQTEYLKSIDRHLDSIDRQMQKK